MGALQLNCKYIEKQVLHFLAGSDLEYALQILGLGVLLNGTVQRIFFNKLFIYLCLTLAKSLLFFLSKFNSLSKIQPYELDETGKELFEGLNEKLALNHSLQSTDINQM